MTVAVIWTESDVSFAKLSVRVSPAPPRVTAGLVDQVAAGERPPVRIRLNVIKVGSALPVCGTRNRTLEAEMRMDSGVGSGVPATLV